MIASQRLGLVLLLLAFAAYVVLRLQ